MEQTLKAEEGIKARGCVTISIIQNNRVIDKIEENNLVVTLGKTNIAKLLGGDVAGSKIAKIAVGTSNATTNITDNAITGMFSKNIVSVTYPDANSVQFNFDIDNDEANGMVIREFGLLNNAGQLFARKVRGGEIEKTNLVRIVGSWKITIN